MARRSHARSKTIFAAIFTTAVVALLSPVALMSAWVHAESLPMQVYSTALGELRRVVLGEQLAVSMNTSTGLTVTNSAQLCEVSLDHGEALFELARESTRPLRVAAGIAVMNTRAATFSVRVRDAKHVDLMVSSGQVTVGTTIVREHQFARISPAGMVLREFNEAEVSRRLEWTTGHIAFTGETLAEAIAEFNRYNVRKLEIADRTISAFAIGGKFSSGDIDSFIAALRPMGIRRMKDDVAKGAGAIRLVGSQESD